MFIYMYSQDPLAKEEYPHLAQVDLVPSISLLLGCPIPYSSLGKIILDLFEGSQLDAVRVNAAQVSVTQSACNYCFLNLS